MIERLSFLSPIADTIKNKEKKQKKRKKKKKEDSDEEEVGEENFTINTELVFKFAI